MAEKKDIVLDKNSVKIENGKVFIESEELANLIQNEAMNIIGAEEKNLMADNDATEWSTGVKWTSK